MTYPFRMQDTESNTLRIPHQEIIMNMRALILAFTVTAAPTMAAEASPKSDIMAFIKKHLIGKTLSMQSSGTLADGVTAYDLSRSFIFSNLQDTPKGFRVTYTTQFLQTNYPLSNGQRGAGKIVKKGISGKSLELNESKVSDDLLGVISVLCTTQEWDITGWDSGVRMRLVDGKLIMETIDAFYSDYFFGDGFRPGTSDVIETFAVTKGRVTDHLRAQSYWVNPKDLSRTPSNVEIQEYKEVD